MSSSTSYIMKPFFVYGTLMKNFRNYDIFLKPKEHAIKIINGTIQGFYLVHFKEGYPGMFVNSKDPSSTVIGEIIFAQDEETHKELQLKLDHLEGYDPHGKDSDNFYVRQNLNCIDENGDNISCDTYICKLNPEDGILLQGNTVSWRKYMEQTNSKGAGDDWAEKQD